MADMLGFLFRPVVGRRGAAKHGMPVSASNQKMRLGELHHSASYSHHGYIGSLHGYYGMTSTEIPRLHAYSRDNPRILKRISRKESEY
jgi:hypothetical protein